MCSSNLRETQVKDTGMKFSGRWTSPFLKTAAKLALNQSLGSFPLSIEHWKIAHIYGASWWAQVFRQLLRVKHGGRA